MANTVQDLVCGMDADSNNTADQSDFNGQTYYFCSPECKDAFDQAPERYIGEISE